MGLEIVNKNKNCVFNGPYAGRDLYITMLEDTEREFVVTHNVNIRPVSYFTGRETELQELRQRIEEGRKLLLVSGMGGIGKTHICRKLFEEYLNKHAADEDGSFQHIGYIEYNGDMGSSLQNCLKFKHQDSPEQNQEAAWRELEYLAADGKLLLFVDNVDKPISADVGLQRLKGIPGAVILTSRQVSVGDEFELYRIGFLGMEQCKEIYGKIRFEGGDRKVNPEEVEDLEYVIENLAGRHTITVELLAHLARTKHWTIKRLREELEKKGFRLTFHKAGELVNIQESYEKLYDLSELTGAEQNILEAFSVFPYIPLAVETCNEWLLADARVSENDDILMGLYQKGWLQLDIEQESYALHPVFSQFIYEKCKPGYIEHCGLIEGCQKCLEVPESGSVLECQQYIPFAENIIRKMDLGKGEEHFEFVCKFAYLNQQIGEYEKSIKWYEKELCICENIWNKNNLNVGIIYNNLAGVFDSRGEYAKAEELHKKSLEMNKRILGEEHPDIARNYNNLAAIYNSQGEYAKAQKLYEKSLQINKRMLGENHPDTARSYSNLAVVYNRQGKYAKAKILYEKSLYIREKVLGENHPDTATSYNNLAVIYYIQDKYEEAKELYEKSLRIRENKIGTHPDTATTYHNLGCVYEKQGKYTKAQELLEKALYMREKIFGENHNDTGTSYHYLGGVYAEQGEYGKALYCLQKAYKIMLSLKRKAAQITYDNLKIVFSKWNPEGNFEEWLEEQMKE